MKKIVICLALLILTNSIYSQQNNPSATLTKKDYLLKSKNQKTTAWILLGGGAACILIGDLVGNSKESSFSDAGAGVVVSGIGVLSMIGSIPLFIASSKNKRKANAMSASIRMENAEVMKGYNMVHTSYPVFSFKINL